MYKVSKIEKEILDTMIRMSENYIVNATMTEIVQATGRKVVGGIHTHALHNLESMGVIRKISRNKWVILNYELEKNEKGSRVVFQNTNTEFINEISTSLKEMVASSFTKEDLLNLIAFIDKRQNIIA